MRLSIKEKAGIADTSRIFEKLHLREDFLANLADEKRRERLEPQAIKDGGKHLELCARCRLKFEEMRKEPKAQDLPL